MNGVVIPVLGTCTPSKCPHKLLWGIFLFYGQVIGQVKYFFKE